MKATMRNALLFVGLSGVFAVLLFLHPAAQGPVPEGSSAGGLFWLATLVMAALAIQSVRLVAALDGSRWLGTATAALFGLWIVYFWQLLVVAFRGASGAAAAARTHFAVARRTPRGCGATLCKPCSRRC
jgi:hypothetical protein